jgi:hypothetical protein
MENDSKLPLSHRRKSGSENRQKQCRVTFRLTQEDYSKVKESASAAGLSVASHVRETMLAGSKIRSRRRPLADVAELAKVYAQLGKIGGNMNQITRRVNFGETPVGAEFLGALAGLKDVLARIRGAMGYES